VREEAGKQWAQNQKNKKERRDRPQTGGEKRARSKSGRAPGFVSLRQTAVTEPMAVVQFSLSSVDQRPPKRFPLGLGWRWPGQLFTPFSG
jgi:hypothetical protein